MLYSQKNFNIPQLFFWVYVLNTQKNRLTETIILRTIYICFGVEMRKLIVNYALLSRGPKETPPSRRRIFQWHHNKLHTNSLYAEVFNKCNAFLYISSLG